MPNIPREYIFVTFITLALTSMSMGFHHSGTHLDGGNKIIHH